jgi:hypothetical protein
MEFIGVDELTDLRDRVREILSEAARRQIEGETLSTGDKAILFSYTELEQTLSKTLNAQTKSHRKPGRSETTDS